MFKIITSLLLTAAIYPALSQTGASISRPSGATNGILSEQLNPAGMANILADPFRGQNFKVSDNSNDVAGNPFLFDDWKKGEVILKNGEKYPIQKMNLDASRNQFIYVVNDSLYEFSDNIRVVKIYGDDHKTDTTSDMIFRTDINPDATNFVQVLTRGKVIIFCEYSKKPEGENYSNGIVNNTRKYVLNPAYFTIADAHSVPIKFSSSELGNLTSDKKDEVMAFVKSNHLKVKNKPDFLKAVVYYNEINSAN
ncbi:MAG TPA: hypothetical protein VIJ92_17480 [Ginsengibacter sp.]